MRKGTKTVVALALLVLVVAGCEVKFGRSLRNLRGKKGEVTNYYKKLKPFDRISIDAVCKVNFTQGDSVSVTASGRKQAMEALFVSVDDGELNISYKPMTKFTRLSDPGTVNVEITAPDLIGVELRGAGSFHARKPVDTDTLRLLLKGAGVINMDGIVCDQLVADLRGTGTMSLSPVTSQRTWLKLKGVGTMMASFDNGGDVDAQLTGVGTINLHGTVNTLSQRTNGTGNINAKDVEERARKQP